MRKADQNKDREGGREASLMREMDDRFVFRGRNAVKAAERILKENYEVTVVFGGGIKVMPADEKHPLGKIYPTGAADGDQYGILWGRVRVWAAALLCLHGNCDTFVASTGYTSKNIEKFKAATGIDVDPRQRPLAMGSESYYYKEAFTASLETFSKKLEGSNGWSNLQERAGRASVLLEEDSVNTATNISRVLDMVEEHGWRKVLLLTSAYHLPRVEAGYLQAVASRPRLREVVFDYGPAEAIVGTLLPGWADAIMDEVYSNDEMRVRIENEIDGWCKLMRGADLSNERRD